MAYKPLFAGGATTQKKVDTSKKTSGYKPLFAGVKTNDTKPKVPDNQGKVVTKTLQNFLGGGAYNSVVGNPNKLVEDKYSTDSIPSKTGQDRDHIVSASAGGKSEPSNLRYVSSKSESQSGQLEKNVMGRYEKGQINLPQARLEIISAKQKEADAIKEPTAGVPVKQGVWGNLLGGIKDIFVKPAESVKNTLSKVLPDKKSEPTTKELAKTISENRLKSGAKPETITASKPTILKKAEFTKNEVIPSTLNLQTKSGKQPWTFKVLNTMYNVPSQAIANLADKASKLTSTEKISPNSVIERPTTNTPLKRVAGGVQTATAALNLIPEWLVFSTGMEAAKEVPILKYPAKALSFGFEKLGQAGSYVAGKGLDVSPISEESKAVLRQPIEELGALATQIYGAKGITKGAGKVLEKTGITSESVKTSIQDASQKVSDIMKEKVDRYVNEGKKITPEIAKIIADDAIKSIENKAKLAETKLSEKPYQPLFAKVKEVESNPGSVLPAAPETKLIEAPQKRAETEGAGFVMTDKADAAKNKLSKATIDYQKSLGIFNDKPTAENLSKVRRLKNEVNKANSDVLSAAESRGVFGSLLPERKISKIEKEQAVEINKQLKPSSPITKETEFRVSQSSQVKSGDKSKAELAEIINPKTSKPFEKASDLHVSHAKVETKNISEQPKEKSASSESKSGKRFQSKVYDRVKKEFPDYLTEDVGSNRQNIKVAVKDAVELIASDKERAYRIAMKAEAAPEYQQVVTNIALSQKALNEGNYKLYAQLVKNRSMSLTELGRAISMEKASITDNSPDRYVKQLIRDKLDSLGEKYLSGLTDNLLKKSKSERASIIVKNGVFEIKNAIKRTKEIDLAEAQKLIDSLTC